MTIDYTRKGGRKEQRTVSATENTSSRLFFDEIRNGVNQNRDLSDNFVNLWRRIAPGGGASAPFRGDDGIGAWSLSFYGYSAQYPGEGEVRSTLFLNENGTYTHLVFSSQSGQFIQQSGLNQDPSNLRVSPSLFVRDGARFIDGQFRVIPGVSSEGLDAVLARSLEQYGAGGYPPIFTEDYPVQ